MVRNMGLFLGLAVKSRVPVACLSSTRTYASSSWSHAECNYWKWILHNKTAQHSFFKQAILFVSKAGAIHSTAPGTVWACFWDHNSNKWFSYFQYTFKPFLPLLQSAEPCYTQCTKLHQEYQIFVSTTKMGNQFVHLLFSVQPLLCFYTAVHFL